MRVLILGGDGMLGHQVYLRLRHDHEARATLRGGRDARRDALPIPESDRVHDVDVRDPDRVHRILDEQDPEAVVNCVGIVKQRPEADDAVASIEVNALFPHRLAGACAVRGTRLIHVSTDCVFSGRRGGYTEEDIPDPVDLYGRSKLLGEVDRRGCLVLRTSMIGPELKRRQGLLEWLLARRGEVRGFRNAIFSGLGTPELARVVAMLLQEHPEAAGIYHVSSEPIAKHDLLVALARELDLPVRIVPDDEPRIDRSLDSSRFRERFRYRPPSWDEMIDELARCVRERAGARTPGES